MKLKLLFILFFLSKFVIAQDTIAAFRDPSFDENNDYIVTLNEKLNKVGVISFSDKKFHIIITDLVTNERVDFVQEQEASKQGDFIYQYYTDSSICLVYENKKKNLNTIIYEYYISSNTIKTTECNYTVFNKKNILAKGMVAKDYYSIVEDFKNNKLVINKLNFKKEETSYEFDLNSLFSDKTISKKRFERLTPAGTPIISFSENKLLALSSPYKWYFENNKAYLLSDDEKTFLTIIEFNLENKTIKYKRGKRDNTTCYKDYDEAQFFSSSICDGKLFSVKCCEHKLSLLAYNLIDGKFLQSWSYKYDDSLSDYNTSMIYEQFNRNKLTQLNSVSTLLYKIEEAQLFVKCVLDDNNNYKLQFGSFLNKKEMRINLLSTLLLAASISQFYSASLFYKPHFYYFNPFSTGNSDEIKSAKYLYATFKKENLNVEKTDDSELYFVNKYYELNNKGDGEMTRPQFFKLFKKNYYTQFDKENHTLYMIALKD